jgi:HEAT repeat protein
MSGWAFLAFLLPLLPAGCSENAGRRSVADLIHDLTHPDENVRVGAAAGLTNFSPSEAREAVPALVEALRDKSPQVRVYAADTLGYLGPEARAAVPKLKDLLRDPDEAVREGAAAALKKIQGS